VVTLSQEASNWPCPWVLCGLQDNKDTGKGASGDCESCPMCRVKVRDCLLPISVSSLLGTAFYDSSTGGLRPSVPSQEQAACGDVGHSDAGTNPAEQPLPGCSLEELKSRAAEAARCEQQLRDEVSRAAAEARKRNDEVRRRQQEEEQEA